MYQTLREAKSSLSQYIHCAKKVKKTVNEKQPDIFIFVEFELKASFAQFWWAHLKRIA